MELAGTDLADGGGDFLGGGGFEHVPGYAGL
jgi:hypothetical protein